MDHGSSYTNTKEAIVHWLTERHSLLPNCVWKRPPKMLAKISSLHLNFFKEHIKYLVSEVEKLETVDVEKTESCSNKTMLATSEVLASTTKSLDYIASHFDALCAVRCDVCELCVWIVRTRAKQHCTGSNRFSYSSPLTTCAWITLLTALRGKNVYEHT